MFACTPGKRCVSPRGWGPGHPLRMPTAPEQSVSSLAEGGCARASPCTDSILLCAQGPEQTGFHSGTPRSMIIWWLNLTGRGWRGGMLACDSVCSCDAQRHRRGQGQTPSFSSPGSPSSPFNKVSVESAGPRDGSGAESGLAFRHSPVFLQNPLLL